MSGALSHLRVVEIAGLGPTPFAAMWLADHGAQVIRIARPGARHVLGLDRDVLEVDVEALKDTQVLATYFAGRQVYGATP